MFDDFLKLVRNTLCVLGIFQLFIQQVSVIPPRRIVNTKHIPAAGVPVFDLESTFQGGFIISR